ncbi:hypothetical protein FRY98_22930 [Paenibacillus faecis]|uniref:Copper amine oxidase N-terminal domain-containing protein n=1 Tax=Paenibacillus faecis TaxID=862114 RepID=A0A5D0CKT3_9BACL|nr:hypothetical protein [Paenibacillus faecis]TYA10653.1 hypothetical protein FRY98_22930 [Paenibacillus faecis]
MLSALSYFSCTTTFFNIARLYKKMESGDRVVRRMITILWLCAGLLASVAFPLQAGSAQAAKSELPIMESDAAVFQVNPHKISAKLNKSTITLDSESLKASPLLRKNGNLYLPIKWLELAHVGKIMKSTKTNSYWVDFSPGHPTTFSNLHFRANSSKLYIEGNGKLTVLEDAQKILPPFMKNNTLYIPVSMLPKMNINYKWSRGTLQLTWNEMSAKVLHPVYTTEAGRITFSSLVQKGYGDVYLMHSMGFGGMTAVSVLKGPETIDKSIKMGNREFSRVEFTVDLRPGPNPLQVHSNDNPSADIVVHRIVKDPSLIPIRYVYDEYKKDIVFNKPTQGFVRVQAGEAIEISGSVITEYIQSQVLGFQLTKFQHGDYQTSGEKTVVQMNENKEFNGSVTINEPGNYLINILSPDVFVGGMTSPYGSMKWAEIAVEVLPKDK